MDGEDDGGPLVMVEEEYVQQRTSNRDAQAQARRPLPAAPVRLFSDGEDPCVRRLQVLSYDQVGLLFKLCELLQSHGMDVTFAEISVEDGIVNNRFELHASRPSDFADADDWCKELEEFLEKNCASGGAALEGSLAAVFKRLSVNPDLLSVTTFREIAVHDGPASEYRYLLELEGINQAGLLTYTALVLYRSGFSVLRAKISTIEGHISDTFELAADSGESERLLRSYLDVPSCRQRHNNVPLPFHATPSDHELQALMQMWGKGGKQSSRASSHYARSREGSWDQSASGAAPSVLTPPLRHRSIKAVSKNSGSYDLSRVPSISSNCEVPTEGCGDARTVKLKVTASDLSNEGSEGGPWDLGREAETPKGEASDGGAWTKRASRRMSVHFANGDVFTGSCTLFDGGEKRHGLGTYVYSPGTHETYKQYRGQWREDKKHGYGVLFYRNGGVYVGQWENNQKHGLGVLLDHIGEGEASAMPSFRYEGQWYEDEMHGLGAEESDSSSYFGHFAHGKRQGQGVKMDLAKMGVKGMKAMRHGGRAVPLLDALEAEIARNSAVRGPSLPSSGSRRDMKADMYQFNEDESRSPQTCHFAGSAEAEARPPLSSINFGSAPVSSPRAPRPRSPVSSPRAPRMGNLHALPTRGDLRDLQVVTPVSETGHEVVTPKMLGACNRGMGRGSRKNGSQGSLCSDLLTPLNGTAQGQGGASSSSAPAQPLPPAGRSMGAGGGIVFSLSEENNLLSPDEMTLHSHNTRTTLSADGTIPEVDLVVYQENAGRSPDTSEDFQLRSKTPSDQNPSSASSGDVAKAQRVLRHASTDPPPPATPDSELTKPEEAMQHPRASAAEKVPQPGDMRGMMRSFSATESTEDDKARHKAAHGGAAVNESGLTGPGLQRGVSINAAGRANRVKKKEAPRVRTPLLWSEDEISAFFSCLGISSEACLQVMKRKIKGIVHLLEMSNSELRREFGLQTPVERLVVRQSLKRLLDADRWENSVRGHRVGDILRDSVLGKFMVPMEELTLVTKISQGGFGTVYRGLLEPSADRIGMKANQPHLVAVKEMKGDLRVRLYELLKEACVMASLKHPNICTFIGVCADTRGKKHYIISELMDCSLFDLIHQPYKLRWHGEITVSLVIALSRGICSGIAYIHAAHLVHADLKSSNILIDYSSSWQLVPRICDFGHAAVRAFPSPHHRCGTPHWAGPEVLRSEALGQKADIYSFGVIMWEMLAQKLPHKGLSFGQVLASVGWAGWTPDMSLLPEIPAELSRLLRECLNFTPPERPSAKDVQRRLRRIPKQARSKALKMLASFMG